MTDDEIMESILLIASEYECAEIEPDEAVDKIMGLVKERE
jgi:hypothetical protein